MAIIDNPVSIDTADIQGVILRGYGRFPHNTYLLLEVKDPGLAKTWLRSVLPQVSDATAHPAELAFNLAFSPQGLHALGLSDANLANFSLPFREGVATPHRQRMLGDYGESDPARWWWGTEKSGFPHILAMVFAPTAAAVQQWIEAQVQPALAGGGIRLQHRYDAYNPADNKEHFGFHDSISQPVVRGSGRPGPDNDIVATGEFVLGYANEHNQYPFSPLITEMQGDCNLLPPDPKGSGHKDLGVNGSFIAYRIMEQDVDGFWQWMRDKTKRQDGSVDETAAVRLASKMVGRWPEGAPLALFPDHDPKINSFDNDFGYTHDPDGLACPFGSHLRRNNPRDSQRTLNPKRSLALTKRHRIIRRGRLYQMPDEQGVTRKGLHFLGVNADIEQQFEFIQHVWANNNQNTWLYDDPDPIIGVPDPADPYNKGGQFTVQQYPVNAHVSGLQRFVHIRAGGYFFVPGILALRYLTTLP